MAEPLGLDAFRAKLRDGEEPESIALRKQFAADSVKAEGDGKSYLWTISTGAVDRDMDRIDVAGWDVSNFLKAGGPVLFAHQSRDLPIGKAPWVKAQNAALKARVEFAPPEANPFAESVRRLVEFGALKSASVGFRPMPGKAAWNEERGGIDFAGQELVEFSIVPVPSNPEALIDAKSAGVDLAPYRAWLERAADGLGLACMSKDQVEAALKALSAPRVSTFQIVRALAAKAGRVLSTANETRLQGALTSIENSAESIDAAAELIEEVLDLAGPSDEPDEPAPKALTVVSAPKFAVDQESVVAAVRAAVSEAVREQVNAARGRLD